MLTLFSFSNQSAIMTGPILNDSYYIIYWRGLGFASPRPSARNIIIEGSRRGIVSLVSRSQTSFRRVILPGEMVPIEIAQIQLRKFRTEFT